MSIKYADIIIDISHEGVDRPFRYKIPEGLIGQVQVGTAVKVPFGNGNRVRNGYVVALADEANWDIDKIKEIQEVSENSLSVEGKLIKLAEWMKQTYGGTMINSLKTVMPVKEKVRERKGIVDTRDLIPEFTPIETLEEAQQRVVDGFISDLDVPMAGEASDSPESSGEAGHQSDHVYLLHGVTGSGKTEVYIRMAEEVIKRGKDVIVLVPEIALTYQTVARFSSYFQDSIAILNSQLSKGEKYREFVKAREGKTHIMIGPRSALFAPFPNLGLIIIDEEHDISYKSETTPKYHAREVAIERARLEGAKVILGSATPSVESYYKAEQSEYKLMSLTDRVKGAALPDIKIVDLREELKQGNRSIISKALYEDLENAFGRGEQAMLFINRRGYNSFVSCRSCGEVIKCPNCDVSLSLHGGAKLMCHYCGHTESMPDRCPKCKSNMIGGYGVGTEKLEQEVKKLFPNIRTLRMDRDTTQKKGAHGEIIRSFREHEADCLIGTQMIVKGHDFPKVTVVGNILADLSLFDSDFESSERTFDLLVQAAGRAGRADLPGNVVIQTYQPEHYAILSAKSQDYKAFYDYEISYRRLLHYPPIVQLLAIIISSDEESSLNEVSKVIADYVKNDLMEPVLPDISGSNEMPHKAGTLDIVGPTEASIYRINNIYRKVIYIKSEDNDRLVYISQKCDERFAKAAASISDKTVIEIQYDFNPMRII
ncbi:replication restart DNA helicase PriA [Lachnospiraceae bacterium]|nr:replication restart DNA helicase PriA [Lachnospiraceae bacterium]